MSTVDKIITTGGRNYFLFEISQDSLNRVGLLTTPEEVGAIVGELRLSNAHAGFKYLIFPGVIDEDLGFLGYLTYAQVAEKGIVPSMLDILRSVPDSFKQFTPNQLKLAQELLR